MKCAETRLALFECARNLSHLSAQTKPKITHTNKHRVETQIDVSSGNMNNRRTYAMIHANDEVTIVQLFVWANNKIVFAYLFANVLFSSSFHSRLRSLSVRQFIASLGTHVSMCTYVVKHDKNTTVAVVTDADKYFVMCVLYPTKQTHIHILIKISLQIY